MRKLLAICLPFLCIFGCSSVNTRIEQDSLKFVRKRSFTECNEIDSKTSKCFETALPRIENPRSVLFAADNQFHNIYTDANFFSIRLSDVISKVAIRPAALNLFSPELFRFILNQNKSRILIHLGDALNLGCRNEWDKFTETLNSVNHQQWVMAPGNHDFYSYGVTSGGWHQWYYDGVWEDSCIGETKEAESRPFRKNDFIQAYLKHLDEKAIIQKTEKLTEETPILGSKIKIITAKNNTGFYRKLEVHEYPDDSQHRSFITQYVNLSENEDQPTIGVILDTTDYRWAPTNGKGAILSFIGLGHNAGLHGRLSDEQLVSVKNSLGEFKPNDGSPLKVVFMGHHALDNLNEDAQKYFLELNQNKKAFDFQGYISAHTHSGFLATHTDKKNNANQFREYNIGSVTDWPVETAVLGEGERPSKLNKITPYDKELSCNPEFDYSASKVSNYTAYRREAYHLIKPGQQLVNAQQRYIMQALVRTMVDLGMINSTSSEEIKISFKELITHLLPSKKCGLISARDCQDENRRVIFDAKKLIEDEAIDKLEFSKKYHNYAVCQALWSSQAEYLSYAGNHEEEE
jgi:Calcineurin-like phosphoesterase